MNCTPKTCPHRALMEKARAACLACQHTEPSGRGGMVSYEAAGEGLVTRQRLDVNREPRGSVTDLPPDIEAKVAELLRDWCAMDSLDALLALHVANGGTPQEFGAYLQRVAAQIAKLQPERRAFRATAWARFKALAARCSVFGRLRSWADGHGGAVRKEREADALPLAEFGGWEV